MDVQNSSKYECIALGRLEMNLYRVTVAEDWAIYWVLIGILIPKSPGPNIGNVSPSA